MKNIGKVRGLAKKIIKQSKEEGANQISYISHTTYAISIIIFRKNFYSLLCSWMARFWWRNLKKERYTVQIGKIETTSPLVRREVEWV